MANESLKIKELLNQADSDNEKQRAAECAPKPEASAPAKASEAAGTSGATGKPDTDNEKTRCEADELIGRYSQKSRSSITDELTGTDALRRSLNSQMANDRELFAYYRGIERKGKSKKVNELYDMLNTATQLDVDDREKLSEPPAVKNTEASHFSDSGAVRRQPEYKQQKFFDLGDTQTLPIEGADKPPATFDSDYDSLSEKIDNGEITFSEENDDAQIAMINEEPAVRKETPEEPEPEAGGDKDENLRRLFDIDAEDGDNRADNKGSGKKRGKSGGKDAKDIRPAYEYVNRTQNSEIQELLTKAIRSSLVKLIFAVLLCGAVLYIELATADSSWHPEYLRPGRYGMLYALVDLQLLFFMTITLLDSVRRGAKGLFTGRPVAESLLFVLIIAASAHCIVTMFFDKSVTLGLFCFPAALMGAVCALVKHLQCRKDYHCFKVIASTRSKYVAEKLTGNTAEAAEFYKYLFDNSEIFTAKKTDFVDGFFRRVQARPESESVNGFIVALTVAAAGVLMGISAYNGSEVYEAYTMFTQTLAFALPFSSFIIIALPVIAANRIGRKNGSAFIGNAVGEEYDEASVISFSDTEVYPSNLVKISSVKVYGDNRIDTVIDSIAKVFRFVGGPLRTVTDNIVSGNIEPPVNPRLIELASDGFCIVMDSREMFLGKREYLRRYRFETPYDEADAAFERKNGSIMFVTRDDALIAKVYIRYTLNPQFNSLLKDLYKAGMCVGIKTTDPNITNGLIERAVKYRKTPISILKSGDVGDTDSAAEHADSGVVANASLHTFLKMFIVCDKIRHVTKANGIICMLSIAVSLFVTFFLSFTGQLAGLGSWYPALYQLLWMLPVGLISFML